MRAGWLLILVALLAGCGFQLRGHQAPLALDSLHVTGGSDMIRLHLEQSLSRDGVAIHDGAPLQLRLFGERHWQRTNVVDQQGRAAGYEIHLSMDWELLRADGLLLIPDNQVRISQSMRTDPTNALATADEETILKQQMRERLIEQLKRQLAIRLVSYREQIADALADPHSP